MERQHTGVHRGLQPSSRVVVLHRDADVGVAVRGSEPCGRDRPPPAHVLPRSRTDRQPLLRVVPHQPQSPERRFKMTRARPRIGHAVILGGPDAAQHRRDFLHGAVVQAADALVPDGRGQQIAFGQSALVPGQDRDDLLGTGRCQVAANAVSCRAPLRQRFRRRCRIAGRRGGTPFADILDVERPFVGNRLHDSWFVFRARVVSGSQVPRPFDTEGQPVSLLPQRVVRNHGRDIHLRLRKEIVDGTVEESAEPSLLWYRRGVPRH